MTTLARIAFFGGLAVVLYFALTPASPTQVPGQDKLTHLAAFGALGLLGTLGWPRNGWTVNLAVLAFGGAIELVQTLTPDRVADARDLLANLAGQALGATGARLWLRAAVRAKA